MIESIRLSPSGQFKVGRSGVTKIERGKWFKVWKGDVLYYEVNAADVNMIEYVPSPDPTEEQLLKVWEIEDESDKT